VASTCVPRVAVWMVSVAVGWGWSTSAAAYQEAGHYYTVGMLAHAVAPNLAPVDASIVSFCAQLPDLSSELDAISVYKSAITGSPFAWLSWATSNSYGSVEARRMITAQQLLHGLTGGKADSVKKVAKSTIVDHYLNQVTEGRSDADHAAALCAMGFAFHLYGDSFAHRVMGDHGAPDPNQMYPTGRGHAADLHCPDLPLCAQFAAAPRVVNHCEASLQGRFNAWQSAWVDAANVFGRGTQTSSVDNAFVTTLNEEVVALEADANDSNMWNEKQMETILAKHIGPIDTNGVFFSQHASEHPCEAVLKDAFTVNLFDKRYAFRCAQDWGLFDKAVEAQFAKEKDARSDLGFPSPSAPYVNPLL